MTDIEKIKEEFKKDKALDSNLDLLIDYSLNNKTLIFDKNIESIDVETLQKAEILKLVSDKNQITNFTIFGYKLYSRFKIKLEGELTKDFKTFIGILKQIESAFKGNKYVQNKTRLLNELWSIAIIDANTSLQIDFSEYLGTLSVERDREDIFSFNEGYSRAMPSLSIDITPFYNNAKQLIEWTKSDADFNMPLGGLLGGIRNKILTSSDFGLGCLKYALNQSDFEVNFLIPVITGLMDRLGIDFFNEHIKKLLTNDEYSVSIICGISNIESVTDVESDLFFEIYENINKENPNVRIYLARLFFAILKSTKISPVSKNIEKSFVCLEELIANDNSKVIFNILQENEYLENHTEFRLNLVLKLIEKPHFKIEYLNPIDHFLWKIKDIGAFEQITYSLAENFGFKSISKYLDSAINEFQSLCKNEFDKIVISLLINDKASYRFIGLDIFNELTQESYSFDFEILTLDSLSQYKLWVSVCQNYREPKNVLPCLLPLLKSNSPLIKEAFICKMEEYSESYGRSVNEVLKVNLDLDDSELKEIFDRIEEYNKSFYKKNILVKEGLKELNPYYSQNKLFVKFNNNYSRIFSRQIQKGSSELTNSFLNFCSKVTLLKGGGWKMDGREEISKLGEFRSSISLPRIYFTQPEDFDLKSNIELSKNWNEYSFIEIKKALEYE